MNNINDNDNDNESIGTNSSEETNYYLYEACEDLLQNVDNVILSSLFNKVKICGYQIFEKSQIPFLQFLLTNNHQDKNLSFPTIDILTISENILLSNTTDLLAYIKCVLNIIFNNLTVLENMVCKGFFLETKTKTIYIFYDFSNCKIKLDLINSNSKYWFALVDEVINKQFICNIQINSSVSQFFLSNQQFISLINNDGNKYEHPVVCYVEKEKPKINFTHFFGIPKMEKGAILGPYYYFTTYDNALKNINLKSNKNNEKMGIIRVAVFLGKLLVKLNYPEDPIDNSTMKRDKTKGSIKEQLTMRITDYDGLWSRNYDSCFIGVIKLDNGDILQDTPIFVVKKYEQHFCLTYHLINNNLDSIM